MLNPYMTSICILSYINVMGGVYIYRSSGSLFWTIVCVLFNSAISAYVFTQLIKHKNNKCQARLKGCNDEQVREKLGNREFYGSDGVPPMILLKELKERGDDIGRYNDVVFGLMESPDEYVRELGVSAFFYVFADAGKLIKASKYRISSSTDEGREAVGKIKKQLGTA